MQTQIKGLNFEGQNVYIGIDVHLKSWTISIFSEHLFHKTFTQPPEVKPLYEYLNRNFPSANYHSVYEAGFCGFVAHTRLKQMGINNIVVNPADVPTSQKEQLQKDDPTDSRKLARSLKAGELIGIYIPTVSTLDERSLVRHRATLVKDMTRFKQRIKSCLYFNGITYPKEFENTHSHWSQRFIQWLKDDVHFESQAGRDTLDFLILEAEQQRKLLLDITRKVREMSRSEKYATNMKLLVSIPGIGLITAMTLLTEIENIERFIDTDHLAGFVGLIPSRHSSGEKEKHGEMTFRGQGSLKRALIESSWVAARRDPALNMAYHKYVQRMDANKAIIRIARKMLNRIYIVLKTKKEYVYGVV